jgi:hypothetical protein
MTKASVEYEKVVGNPDQPSDRRMIFVSNDLNRHVAITINRYPNPDEIIEFEHGPGDEDPLVIITGIGEKSEFPPSPDPCIVWLDNLPGESEDTNHVLTIDHIAPTVNQPNQT